MKITLAGRLIRSAPLMFEKEIYHSYQRAVVTGQQRYGRGNFLVDCGGRAPSRSEQLLRCKSKRSMMLESL